MVREMSEQHFKEVIYEPQWHHYVARITLNRPKAMNAYTSNTLRELNKALEDAMWNNSIQLMRARTQS